MTATKVVFIVLIVIVVLFVVLAVWGSENATVPRPDPKNFNSSSYPGFDSLNTMLAPFGPKFQAKDMQPPLTKFNLSSTAHYQEHVLPDSSNKFRQAKFTVQTVQGKRCAHVVYTPSNPPDSLKKSQDSNDDTKHVNQFTLTILEGGGTLTVDRTSSLGGACEVTLQ
jgi:hypothetical protein